MFKCLVPWVAQNKDLSKVCKKLKGLVPWLQFSPFIYIEVCFFIIKVFNQYKVLTSTKEKWLDIDINVLLDRACTVHILQHTCSWLMRWEWRRTLRHREQIDQLGSLGHHDMINYIIQIKWIFSFDDIVLWFILYTRFTIFYQNNFNKFAFYFVNNLFLRERCIH